MQPLSYQEWCSTTDRDDQMTPAHLQVPEDRRQRYHQYLDAVAFIQTQVGGVPSNGFNGAVELIN